MTAFRDEDKQEPSPARGSVPWVINQLGRLIDEIVADRAVLYVGAGVSQSASLKSWKELLKGLCDEAALEMGNDDPLTTDYFQKLMTQNRSLEIGDWLLKVLGNAGFAEAIRKLISPDTGQRTQKPSAIHQNLTRLRFSTAITTNYDLLLEDAYKMAEVKYGTSTWRNVQQILASIKKADFRIIHAHGVYDDPSTLVLSASQYAALQHTQPEADGKTHQLRFGDVFKWLLKTKTFLFLGASLDDPDLIFHLQEVKAEHGDYAGEHFALLPYDDAPPRRCAIFFENLRVKIIPVGSPELGKGEKKAWMTDVLAGVLREISAKVASKKIDLGLSNFPTSDDPNFYLDGALEKLLDEAVRITGSFRGDFCLLRDPESHGPFKLEYAISSSDKTQDGVRGTKVDDKSICGIAFYQAAAEYGVYVANVRKEPLQLDSRLGHYGKVFYKEGHFEVMSELAMPIEADGVRVGVLNLESKLIDAYSQGHRDAAKKLAEKAGRLYTAASERRRRGRRLSPERTAPAYREMRGICERLWRIARDGKLGELEVALLIYHADHISGQLVAQDPLKTIFLDCVKPNVEAPKFPFRHAGSKDDSLAARVYHYGRPYSYPDAHQAVVEGKLPKDSYPALLGIQGPLIGFPVSIHGHISGVVVAWLRKAPGVKELDGRDIDLFRRASHIMANCFQFKHEDGRLEETHRFASVERVETILKCVENPKAAKAVDDDQLLNEVGTHYRAEIGPALTSFLELLSSREQEFSDRMRDWYKNRPRPTLWISPRRCRCWVRAGLSSTGKPRFLLALEATLEAQYPYKNSVEWNSTVRGVAMQPFRAARENGFAAFAPDGTTIEEEDIQVAFQDKTHCVKSVVFDNNPHLSFLLSRISVYPFAFRQKPGVIGEDIMSKVLQKDPKLPWIVCPLIVGSRTEWAGRGYTDKTGANKQSIGLADRCLTGYLTFDNGRHDVDQAGETDRLAEANMVEVKDQWASFQNDLIHQADLFASCIAQKSCFRDLAPRLIDCEHSMSV